MFINPYPRYLLNNGIIVDFMCMNRENLELYHSNPKGIKLIYDRQNNMFFKAKQNTDYPDRGIPLFGTIIEKEIY